MEKVVRTMWPGLVLASLLLASPLAAMGQERDPPDCVPDSQDEVSRDPPKCTPASKAGAIYDPQTDLMTVVEPKIEADTTSASPLGDDYDPATGGITFSATDIALPGNFDIPVELRRWVPTDDYDTGGPTGWTWNIPFIRGNYLDVKDGHGDAGWDWGLNTWHDGYNCSGGGDSATNNRGDPISSSAYWQGKLLHIPGVTSETFLEAAGSLQITKSHFKIVGCINNPGGQQGIVVAGPDGLTYTFNQIKSYYNGKATLKDPIVRTRLLLVTKIEDRFGNRVDYTYTNGELAQISATDGRAIAINYELSGSKWRPVTAVAHGRTWTYAYQAGSGGKLASVTLPDGAKWEYDNVTTIAFDPNFIAGYQQLIRTGGGQPNQIPGCTAAAGQPVATIRSPWGALSTYTFKDTVHYRSDVAPDVYADAYMDGYAVTRTLNCTVRRSLIAKTVSGPGVGPYTWNYAYSTNRGTYTQDSGLNGYLIGPFDLPMPFGGYPSPITSGTAVNYRSTAITGPDQRLVFYIDRKFQSISESRVVAQDVLNAAGTQLLQREESVFSLGDYVGEHWYICSYGCTVTPVNQYQLSNYINLSRKTLTRDGRTFNWQVPSTCGGTGTAPCFDQYARPTKVVRSSTP